MAAYLLKSKNWYIKSFCLSLAPIDWISCALQTHPCQNMQEESSIRQTRTFPIEAEVVELRNLLQGEEAVHTLLETTVFCTLSGHPLCKLRWISGDHTNIAVTHCLLILLELVVVLLLSCDRRKALAPRESNAFQHADTLLTIEILTLGVPILQFGVALTLPLDPLS